MVVSTGTSFILASISSVLILSGMQMFKLWLGSSQLHTLLGGYFGSLLFVLLLTAVGNLETYLFGKSSQVKVCPEVLFCMLVSLLASATIHRVCSTTCFLLSLCALYYLDRYSQRVYTVQTAPPVVQTGKKKRHNK